MNAMLTTAVPLPAILEQPTSDSRARRHHIGDFDLGAADLDRFNTLLIRLGRDAPLDRDRVATAARELRASAKDAFEPACIQQRMVRLQAAANMIGDMQWTTPDDAGNAAELIVHYALGQQQLLPDTLPTIGRLDDAIAIDADDGPDDRETAGKRIFGVEHGVLVFLQILVVAARPAFEQRQQVDEVADRTPRLAADEFERIGILLLRHHAAAGAECIRQLEEAVSFAVKEGIPVMYVTEDMTRADPETLRLLYSAAIRTGATRVCVADTVGHATPFGAAAVVRFIQGVVDECGGGIGIDWHGHRDRGLDVMNAIAALEAGATRLHATALGIGERVGNTPMDLLLVNLVLMGYLSRNLNGLGEYCALVPSLELVAGQRKQKTQTEAEESASCLSTMRRGSNARVR